MIQSAKWYFNLVSNPQSSPPADHQLPSVSRVERIVCPLFIQAPHAHHTIPLKHQAEKKRMTGKSKKKRKLVIFLSSARLRIETKPNNGSEVLRHAPLIWSLEGLWSRFWSQLFEHMIHKYLNPQKQACGFKTLLNLTYSLFSAENIILWLEFEFSTTWYSRTAITQE